MSAALDGKELNRAAAIAARFRKLDGLHPGLAWPVVAGGALFGSDGTCIFYAGPVDLVDGWVVPDTLNLDAWGEASTRARRGIRGDYRPGLKLEKEAAKTATGWRHVESLENPEVAGVPRLWDTFRRDVVDLPCAIAFDPDLAKRFRDAARDLEEVRFGQITLTGSQARTTSPMHVFFRGQWRGCIMPCLEDAPDDNTIPAPQKFAGVEVAR